jgi:hypothetical protein
MWVLSEVAALELGVAGGTNIESPDDAHKDRTKRFITQAHNQFFIQKLSLTSRAIFGNTRLLNGHGGESAAYYIKCQIVIKRFWRDNLHTEKMAILALGLRG